MHSATYIENYLDCVENLPDDVQRNITQLREIDLLFKEVLDAIAQLQEELQTCDLDARKQKMCLMQKNLIKSQELFDEKIQLLQQTQDIIDNKSRQLEVDSRSLSAARMERGNRTPSHVSHEASNTPPVPAAHLVIDDTHSPAGGGTPTDSGNETNGPESHIEKRPLRGGNSGSGIGSAMRGNTSNGSGGLYGNNGGYDNHEQQQQQQRNTGGQKRTRRKAAMDYQEPKRGKQSYQSKQSGKRGGGGQQRRSTNKQSRNSSNNNNNVVEEADDSPPGVDLPIDPDEPTYCLCEQVSFGEMIGCDNDDCPIEWFHFQCVALTNKPKGKWYCPKCRGERSNQINPRLLQH